MQPPSEMNRREGTWSARCPIGMPRSERGAVARDARGRSGRITAHGTPRRTDTDGHGHARVIGRTARPTAHGSFRHLAGSPW